MNRAAFGPFANCDPRKLSTINYQNVHHSNKTLLSVIYIQNNGPGTDAVDLGDIIAPIHGQGLGRVAMTEFAAWVDGFEIAYSSLKAVQQDSAWPVCRLKRFYAWYGFREVHARSRQMERRRKAESYKYICYEDECED